MSSTHYKPATKKSKDVIGVLKKTLAIAFGLAAAFAISACGGSSDDLSNVSEQTNTEQESAEIENQSQSQDYYDVVISGADVVSDENGAQAIVVAFDFTNNTNTPISFMQAVPTAAIQDGVSLGSSTYFTGYTGADGVTPDFMLKIDPGASSTVHMGFALASKGNVTIRCSLGYVDSGYPNPSVVLAEQEYSIA